MEPRIVARWQTRGSGKWGKTRFLELVEEGGLYSYRGNEEGGSLPASIVSDDDAVAAMEADLGPVTVLRADFKSLRRVK